MLKSSDVDRYDLELSEPVPRHPDTVVEQIVAGLVGGGMLGHGLAIQGRERGRITFACSHAFSNNTAESGVIEVVRSDLGSLVTCRLACRWLAARSVVASGAVAAVVTALTGGGLPIWGAGLAGLLTWIGVGVGHGALSRRRLVQRARTYIANAKYLKAL